MLGCQVGAACASGREEHRPTARRTIRACRSLSKNEGLVDNPEVKAWFLTTVEEIMKKRPTPLNLIIENSPGQKWHPNDKPPPPVREEF